MTMVSTGEISIGGNATSGGLNRSINIELGRAATATSSLNESALRTLAGVPSGAISLSNFYGKSNTFSFTISSNQTNANLRTLAVNAGWNQSSKVIATIASGVYCSSNSTGTPGLTINGSFPSGVELINSGFIVGMGGAGGNGQNSNGSGGSNGFSGGLALSVSVAVSVNNAGTIGGGGGGGGGGGWVYWDDDLTSGGGGGGGGRTGTTNSSGGSGGTGNFTGNSGGAGTSSGAGSGGISRFTLSGGNGGNWGVSGSNGQASNGALYTGGAAGAAVSGNSNITWIAFGTRLGSIS